jgi:hypothetical protein
MTSYLPLLSCLVTSLGGFLAIAPPVAATPSQLPLKDSPTAVCQLAGGLRARVQGSEVVITNGAGAVVARNSKLIRREDEDQSCPSDGFERMVAKGDYFTIEQQTCGGWFFIKEYITFRYVRASGKIVLHKYGRVATDRRDPNKEIPAEQYTAKQLGQRSFAQVTKASLDAVGR